MKIIILEDAINCLNRFWEIVKKKLPPRYIGIFALFVFLIYILLSYFLPELFKSIIQGNETENIIKKQMPRTKPSAPPNFNNGENCYTDWIDFTKDKDKWEGLISRFEEVNGVFSVPDQTKQVDSVAFYQKPCKGGIKADLEFVPYSEKLINLNLYYGNWFRWEIGGNDLNSVKLYKNIEGCTAFKNARPVETATKYLSAGEKIKTKELVYASMLVFLTESGKLRTELHLKFTSSRTERTVEANDLFYYEFDVGWKCDQNTVLNIENDYERIGVGLMPSFINKDAETPRVRLNRFRTNEYSRE